MTIETRSFIFPDKGPLLLAPNGCCGALLAGDVQFPDLAGREILIVMPFLRFLERRLHSISHLQIMRTRLDQKGCARICSFFLISFNGGHPVRSGEDGRPFLDTSRVVSDSGPLCGIDAGRFASVLDALLDPEACPGVFDNKRRTRRVPVEGRRLERVTEWV